VTEATIDVQRPPSGWSHLSGPQLHVLVALPPSDPRYEPAAAAAVGGDLDDVLDVLASEVCVVCRRSWRSPGLLGLGW
jgi:hypothetical protein